LFILVFVVFQSQVLQQLVPRGWRTDLTLWHQGDFTPGEEKMVRLPWLSEKLLMILVQCSLPPIFWIIAYFRLKEKEV
jgi:hypothetical protein